MLYRRTVRYIKFQDYIHLIVRKKLVNRAVLVSIKVADNVSPIVIKLSSFSEQEWRSENDDAAYHFDIVTSCNDEVRNSSYLSSVFVAIALSILLETYHG